MTTRTAPALGLVCLSSDRSIRYRTITRTRLFSLPAEEQTSALRSIYDENAATLDRAIDYCRERNIGMYRIPSGIFPSSEDGEGSRILDSMAPRLKEIGERAIHSHLRLVMHPDQFVVLSSESDAVVRNSVGILIHQARVMDLLAQPLSPWAAIQIHGGKGGRSTALVQVLATLPDPVRTRLALENDEYAYSAREILAICRASGVPMVFDAHHHIVHENLGSYEDPSVHEMTLEAGDTWPDRDWQIVHISNGRESFGDPCHSDLIHTLPGAFHDVPWIEVEAKSKELAIAEIQQVQAWN